MQINLLDYLQQSAELYPEKLAFADESAGLSFKELFDLSGAIGSLIGRSVPGAVRRPFIVPVERSCENIAAMMGVLYSGNFYVPLDAYTPKPRMAEIIRQLTPAGVVFSGSTGAWRENFESCGPIVDCAEAKISPPDFDLLDKLRSSVIDTDPAYVIFTSGSTGSPKGIVVPHRAVIDLAEWLTDVFGFTSDDVFAQQTPFFFDASVKDIYSGIKTGATVRIMPKGIFTFPLKVVEYMNTHKVTCALWATSAASMISSSGVFEYDVPRYLSKMSFAGETLYAKHLNKWRAHVPNAKYINLYGPTEATVDAAYFVAGREFGDDEVIPIGTACRNMEVFLLDAYGEVIPPERTHESGEICIRGTAVASGYFRDRQKTDDAFIQDPRNNSWRENVYKTGDIARYNEYGELVFVSRVDGQVKHMGARVELGDIEASALSLTEVSSAVCVYDPARDRIALFYTGSNDDVLKQLRGALPPYMCPEQAIHLEQMPLTRNGKADRVTLEQGFRDGSYK